MVGITGNGKDNKETNIAKSYSGQEIVENHDLEEDIDIDNTKLISFTYIKM